MVLSKDLLDILACPKCKGDLEYTDDKLICNLCRLIYKVEDDIPIMLTEEAEKF